MIVDSNFDNILRRPTIQGIGLAIIIAWIALHTEIDNWNVLSATGKEKLILGISFLLFVLPYL